jgi:hypothetical protein
MTGVQLELFTDEEESLFIGNNIRGGIATISHRLADANNKYAPETFDPEQPNSFITYLDCNNLYGYAMCQPLPIGAFRYLFDWEVDIFDPLQIPDDNEKGYILEVDLEYPPELHGKHNDYPLAPEKLKVTPEMLSPYCQSFSRHGISSEKLIPNLQSKSKYVLHYSALKLYLQLGMKLSKIHRVLEFDQSVSMDGPLYQLQYQSKTLSNLRVDRYGDKAKLLFTDTDSLCYHIQTDDLYSDMAQNLDSYDISNYDETHPLFSSKNAKIVGKFKDECGGDAPVQFVGLRAKMYSLLLSKSKKPKMTAKGLCYEARTA